jgi:tetratricopeptide (TPR) repeat protein
VTAAPPRDRREAWLTAIAPAFAIALHARTIGFGFTELDDRDLVVDDQAFLAAPGSLVRAFGRAYMHVVDPGHAYYRPLVTVSYALDARWSGAAPAGYHVTNVALHALATALVFVLLRRLAMPAVVALAAALVFAAHPALAAAVAWIPGRNDSLLAVFGLSAWLAFADGRARPSPMKEALHVASFALALLTKETAIALPVVWVLEAVLVDGERRWTRSATVHAVAWAACALGFALLHARPAAFEAGAVFAPFPVLLASLGKLIFPLAPTVLAVATDLPVWPGVLAAGLLAGGLLVPGVRRGVVVFGLAAFVALLAPALVMGGTLVLDSRLVLPAVGVLIALAEIARAAAFRPMRGDGSVETAARTRLFAALAAVLVLMLAAVTAGYEGAFHDRRAFAREAAAGSPHSALAHFCLGQSYQRDGDDERALAEYRTSLALGPGEVVHNNVAVLYMRGGRWAEAERELRAEIALDPRYAKAYANLAIVLRREGRDDEASQALATAHDLGGP